MSPAQLTSSFEALEGLGLFLELVVSPAQLTLLFEALEG